MTKFSPTTLGFYPEEHVALYEARGTLPTDLLDVTEETEAEFRIRLEQNQTPSLVDGVLTWQVPVVTDQEWAARITAQRYARETQGITVDGQHIATDRQSAAILTGVALSAFMDPNYTCRWKCANSWITLTAPQILAAAAALRTHVQACFDREEELLTALSGGTFNPSQLDEGWPV